MIMMLPGSLSTTLSISVKKSSDLLSDYSFLLLEATGPAINLSIKSLALDFLDLWDL